MRDELTKAQLQLLRDIRLAPKPINNAYPPAKRLVALGHAEWIRGKWSDRLQITESGLAYLRTLSERGEP